MFSFHDHWLIEWIWYEFYVKNLSYLKWNEITNWGLKGRWNKLFTREASTWEVWAGVCHSQSLIGERVLLVILIGCIQPPPETLLCRSTSFKWVKWNPSKPLSDIVISCCCPKELQDSQRVSCGVMGKVSSEEFCCLVYCLNSTVQQHLHFTEKKKWGQVHHPIIIATIFWGPTMCYYVLPEDTIITMITLS